MVVLLLAGVMFPLWPLWMRQGVWYLSVGLLGLIAAFFVLAIVRLILWAGSAVVGKGFWLFPNLFADVGFVDSFIPVWEWDVPPPPKKSKKSSKTGSATDADGQLTGKEGASAGEASTSASDSQVAASTVVAKGAKAKGSSSASGTATPSLVAQSQEKPKRESDKLADLD